MSKERDEFIAVLTREFSHLPMETVIQAAKLLMRHGRSYARVQEDVCNGHPAQSNPYMAVADINKLQEKWDARCERDDAKFERLIRRAAESIGAKVDFSGDPRGATVKLILPSGRSNSFGGEGWCVPNS